MQYTALRMGIGWHGHVIPSQYFHRLLAAGAAVPPGALVKAADDGAPLLLLVSRESATSYLAAAVGAASVVGEKRGRAEGSARDARATSYARHIHWGGEV